jgi:hypothetical protein
MPPGGEPGGFFLAALSLPRPRAWRMILVQGRWRPATGRPFSSAPRVSDPYVLNLRNSSMFRARLAQLALVAGLGLVSGCTSCYSFSLGYPGGGGLFSRLHGNATPAPACCTGSPGCTASPCCEGPMLDGPGISSGPGCGSTPLVEPVPAVTNAPHLVPAPVSPTVPYAP